MSRITVEVKPDPEVTKDPDSTKVSKATKPKGGAARFAIQSKPRSEADWETSPFRAVYEKRAKDAPAATEGDVPESGPREFVLGPGERLVIEDAEGTMPIVIASQNAAVDIRDTQWFADGLPTIESLSPSEAAIGGADVEMTVTGSGFIPQSAIVFNGGAEPTTFVSDTSLTTMVKPSLATVAGAFPVTVNNGPLVSEPAMFSFTTGGAADSQKVEKKPDVVASPPPMGMQTPPVAPPPAARPAPTSRK